MIDVHSLANLAVQDVNADMTITWVQATGGYTTDAAGHRTPNQTTQAVQANVQGLSGKDLQQVNSLGIQGVLRAVHLYGDVQGIIRASQQGGDTLVFPERWGGVPISWKVVTVMETWPTWCRVIVAAQQS